MSDVTTFISSLDELVTVVTDELVTQADDESLQVLEPQLEAIEQQFSRLTGKLGQAYQRAREGQVIEANQFLADSAGVPIIRSATTIASDLSTDTSRIAASDIVSLIKKIIEELLDILGIDLPDWFQKIIDLIDELLQELFGIGRSQRLADKLSKRHANFMREQAALAEWRNV